MTKPNDLSERLKNAINGIAKILEEGGPRTDELRAKMRKSIEDGKEQIRRSEEAYVKLRKMSDADWWEECYQKGIGGSGATAEWLAKRKLEDM